jgi:hypothetical protein
LQEAQQDRLLDLLNQLQIRRHAGSSVEPEVEQDPS